MSKDDIYVIKKKAQEVNGFEVLDDDFQQVEKNDEWELVNKTDSTYHTEYERHMNMQQKMKGLIADNSAMTDIKRNLAEISEAMESEIAATATQFRVQMANTVLLYESLIESCNSYINTVVANTAAEKERLRMVKDVLEQAKQERIHFVDVGSGMQIFKDRVEGMVLGNVLGGILTEYNSVFMTDELDKGLVEDDFFVITKEMEFSEQKQTFKLNTYSETLDESSKANVGMYRICKFLGAGNLCATTQLAMTKGKGGDRYFGKRTERAYGEAKKASFDELKDMAARKYEQNPDSEAHIEYTGDALKQLSTLYLLRLIAGKADVNKTDDISLVYSEKEINGKTAYTVTGAFLQETSGYFSEMDATALQKGSRYRPSLDGLPLPALDEEFVTSILVAEPEDFGFLVDDLQLSKAQKNAFYSRLKWIQKTLHDKMADEMDHNFLQRGLLKPSEWDGKENHNELQRRFAKQKIMFPSMFGKDARVEGADNKNETDAERGYCDIYHTLKEKVKAEKDPRKAMLILGRFAAGVLAGTMNGFSPDGFQVGGGLIGRLVDELITEDMLKELVIFRYEANKRIAEAYDKKAREVKEVPKDFLNQTAIDKAIGTRLDMMRKNAGKNKPFDEDAARKKAIAKVEKEIKEQYIVYLIQKESQALSIDMQIANAMIQNLGEISFCNNTMNYKHIDPVAFMTGFSKTYAASVPEGNEAYQKISNKGYDLSVIMDSYSLLNKQKVKELKDENEAETKKSGWSDCKEHMLLMQGNPLQKLDGKLGNKDETVEYIPEYEDDVFTKEFERFFGGVKKKESAFYSRVFDGDYLDGGSSSQTYEDLKDFANSSPIEFSANAIKQLSRLYLLRLIAGKERINNLDDVKLFYTKKALGNKFVYTVTGAYMDVSEGFFSTIKPDSLKKGSNKAPALDGLPLPIIDEEYVRSILMTKPENILLLVKDQNLSKTQQDALISRFKWVQAELTDKLDKEKNLPIGSRSIIKPQEWADSDIQSEIKNKIAGTEDKKMFPGMLGSNVHIEGVQENKTIAAEKNYYKVYSEMKKKILSERNPRKVLHILGQFMKDINDGKMNYLTGDIHGTIVATEIAQRLIDELSTEALVKECVKMEYEIQKRFVSAYEKKAKEVTQVPKKYRVESAINEAIQEKIEEMGDEDGWSDSFDEEAARQKAEAEIENEIKEQYIFCLVVREDKKLADDIRMINDLYRQISSLENNTMSDFYVKPRAIIADYSQRYASSRPEGTEGFKEITEKGRGLYKRCSSFDFVNAYIIH